MTKEDCVRLIGHCWEAVRTAMPNKFEIIEMNQRKCKHCDVVQTKMAVSSANDVSDYWIDYQPSCQGHL